MLKNLLSWARRACFFILLAAGQPAFASGTVNPTTSFLYDCHAFSILACPFQQHPYSDYVAYCPPPWIFRANNDPSYKYICIYPNGVVGLGIIITSNVGCPENSTVSGTACICNTDYEPDANKTSCVPAVKCPVTALTHPPFSDACSTSLEAGKGVDVNQACGTLREPDMVAAAACIATKINKLSSPPVNYKAPSATIRTEAYQNHLLEIWDKSATLNCLMNSLSYTPEYLAAMRVACAQRKTEVNKEKSAHGITHQPSSSGDAAPHVEHRAIDVPEAVSDALMDQVTLYSTTTTIVNGKKKTTTVIVSDVEDYIHSATVNPPACDSNISWGGRFDSNDWVHFQLP